MKYTYSFIGPRNAQIFSLIMQKIESGVPTIKMHVMLTSEVKSLLIITFTLRLFTLLFPQMCLTKGSNFRPYQRVWFDIPQWHTRIQKSGKRPPPLGRYPIYMYEIWQDSMCMNHWTGSRIFHSDVYFCRSNGIRQKPTLSSVRAGCSLSHLNIESSRNKSNIFRPSWLTLRTKHPRSRVTSRNER